MAHFGIISPPVPGHLYPFIALSHQLAQHGHTVTFFHMEDVGARIRPEGFGFCPIGQTDHPAGSLPVSLAQLGTLDGIRALNFTIRAVEKTTAMFLRDAPDAIARAGVDVLLVDQMEPAGGTIAELLRKPFFTICNALALNREDSVPPAFSPWPYRDNPAARARNRIGYALSRFTLRHVTGTVARYRELWGLPRHRDADESFSSLGQFSQQIDRFDYPRRALPSSFRYVGPLRFPRPGQDAGFPWHRLDGRPLIYASLGTLQNSKEGIFRTIVEACRPLHVQLVLSHGGGLGDAAIQEFSRSALVVPWAPQQQLLSRARLTITHAGLNTMLDTLSQGVPAIAIPITYEQPAIAARLKWTGAGEVISLDRLSIKQLQSKMSLVLGSEKYYASATSVQRAATLAGGVRTVVQAIENTLFVSPSTAPELALAIP